MGITERITDIWKEWDRVHDWNEPGFSWRKAYLAAVLAKLPYLHIPQFELAKSEKAGLIPCLEYREIVSGSESPGLRMVLDSSGLGHYFVVERPLAVAVVVDVKGILFISLRATMAMYDWGAHLNTGHEILLTPSGEKWPVRQYFSRALDSCLEELHMEIVKCFGMGQPIYVTGHSLGGSLAALLHLRWRDAPAGAVYPSRARHREYRLATHSCYTFGMPRYAAASVVRNCALPFHVYNREDIVAQVPSRFWGYADAPGEICLGQEGVLKKGGSFLSFLFNLATLKSIREHDIEFYQARVRHVRDLS